MIRLEDRQTIVAHIDDAHQAGARLAKACEIVGIDAIIITKLDGTAKGGSLFGIAKALELPILYLGVGEGKDDLIPFNADEYIDTILDSLFTSQNG